MRIIIEHAGVGTGTRGVEAERVLAFCVVPLILHVNYEAEEK